MTAVVLALLLAGAGASPAGASAKAAAAQPAQPPQGPGAADLVPMAVPPPGVKALVPLSPHRPPFTAAEAGVLRAAHAAVAARSSELRSVVNAPCAAPLTAAQLRTGAPVDAGLRALAALLGNAAVGAALEHQRTVSDGALALAQRLADFVRGCASADARRRDALAADIDATATQALWLLLEHAAADPVDVARLVCGRLPAPSAVLVCEAAHALAGDAPGRGVQASADRLWLPGPDGRDDGGDPLHDLVVFQPHLDDRLVEAATDDAAVPVSPVRDRCTKTAAFSYRIRPFHKDGAPLTFGDARGPPPWIDARGNPVVDGFSIVGARITALAAGGLVESCGFAVGDLLLQIDDCTVGDFVCTARRAQIDQDEGRAQFTLLRDGETVVLTVDAR